MEQLKDTYLTIAEPVQSAMRERSSKFLSFAYPVRSVGEIKEIVDDFKKRYYDATHRCYAYRLGSKGEEFRANDDGEPSGTAGKPILGQLLSRDVTNCLIVVVRYFGGTKLGVSGLIMAYREAAADALDNAQIIECTVDAEFVVAFPYIAMNDVMRAIKELQVEIQKQTFDNLCSMKLAIRESKADFLMEKLQDIEGVSIEKIQQEYGE